MSILHGVHGQHLEVTILRCTKLKNTEVLTKQDPYVLVEYCNCKFRTKTCTDGGKNPVFGDDKFKIPLVEGMLEMSISVWNSNTIMHDTFIGSGRVQLHKVIIGGFDDSPCVIQTKSSKYAGDVKLIMQFQRCDPSAPPSAPYPPQIIRTLSESHHGFCPQPKYPPPSPNPYPASMYLSPMHQQAYPPELYTYPSPQPYMPQNPYQRHDYPPDPQHRQY